MSNYQVVVGNIGKVYSGGEEGEARAAFENYKQKSMSGTSRAAFEDVTLFKDSQLVESVNGLEYRLHALEQMVEQKLDADDFDRRFTEACKEEDFQNEREVEDAIGEAFEQFDRDNEFITQKDVESMIEDFEDQIEEALKNTELVQDVATQVAMGAAAAQGFVGQKELKAHLRVVSEEFTQQLAFITERLNHISLVMRHMQLPWWKRLFTTHPDIREAKRRARFLEW